MQAERFAGASRRLACALLIAASANAAVITSVSGPVAGSGSASGVISGTNLTLTESISAFAINDGFALVLGLTSPPGATTYAVTKTITNSSGTTWTDFFVGVGCDANPNNPTAPRASVDCYSSGLSLGITGTPGTSAGGISGMNGGSFSVGGINIAPGQTLTLTFNLVTCPNCSGGDVMFQHANVGVPEPSTTTLIGSALLALPMLRRLRRRSSR